MELASLASALSDTPIGCHEFQHQLIDSNIAIVGSGLNNLYDFKTITDSALIITGLDIKVLFDITDTTFSGTAGNSVPDYRSTFDLNPYGPYAAGSGGVGQIIMSVDSDVQFALAWDVVINHQVLFVVGGGKTVLIQVNAQLPAGKKVTLVPCLIAFTCREAIATLLKKNTTQIITV